jgi:23S rRNA (uracil1939-C5)-methyltransferase/tRNA (uracil-5-)-methyltransferase
MIRPPKKFHPHPFAYHQEIELEITTLTNMGQGLGRVDGWVVLVPFALPGEKIVARIYRNDKNFSEGDFVRTLTRSPHRVEPRCPLFMDCGGCQYQNMAYSEQLVWKQRQVAELLKHMAQIEFPVEPVFPSPQQYNYRSKITPHFEQPRDGKIGEIGFLRPGRGRSLVDVPRCEIATEAINAALPAVRAKAHANAANFRKGVTLLLRDASGVVHTDHQATATEQVCGKNLQFLAGDFFQNNPYILDAFTNYGIEQAKSTGAEYLVDTYCGSGLFALVGAEHFKEVLGIEISESAVVRATSNAQRNGLSNCKFLAGAAQNIFEKVTFPADQTAILIDPPRAGCDEAFLNQLFLFAPRTVVYVSCNPATQMRDLKQFTANGYRPVKIQPFDLFPQTKHLECVITLEKSSS